MSAEDWNRDEQQVRAMRCEIAAYPTKVFERVAPKCGRPASWWSDDLGPTTVWMCDECCHEVVHRSDGLAVTEVER